MIEKIGGSEKPRRRELTTSDLIRIGLAALATGTAGDVMRKASVDPALQTKIEEQVKDAASHKSDEPLDYGYDVGYTDHSYDAGYDQYYDSNEYSDPQTPATPSEEK